MTRGHADRIFLRGLLVHARIGSGDDAALQSLVVDLEVAIELGKAAASDALADTTNYADLARVIADTVSAGKHLGLGAAAAAAADGVLTTERKVSEVKLTLRNPRAVLDRPVDQIGVTVVRNRL